MWTADRAGVVHLRNCAATGEGSADYFVQAHDADQLVAHLERPDMSNGHSAASPIRACAECIAPLIGA